MLTNENRISLISSCKKIYNKTLISLKENKDIISFKKIFNIPNIEDNNPNTIKVTENNEISINNMIAIESKLNITEKMDSSSNKLLLSNNNLLMTKNLVENENVSKENLSDKDINSIVVRHNLDINILSPTNRFHKLDLDHRDTRRTQTIDKHNLFQRNRSLDIFTDLCNVIYYLF